MALSRRNFLKISAGSAAALGVSLFENPTLRKAFAAAVKETPVIWLAAGACSGCSVSLLNSLSPRIQDLLLDQVIPGHHTELAWHPTVMAASGDLAMEQMYAVEEQPFLLVVEGSVGMAEGGSYMEVGERDGHGIPTTEHVERLGKKAQAVLAVGSCASYGGINKANMNPSQSVGVAEFLTLKGVKTPVINLPGCAVHPDWFVGTVAALLLGGLAAVKLDDKGRPEMHYKKLIHDNCPLRGHFDAGRFAEKFSDDYCLYKLGCKGPVTRANCPEKRFNSGTNWCIENRHPCLGCAEPEFPYEGSLHNTVPLQQVTPPAAYPPIHTEHRQDVDFTPTYGALAGLAVGAAGMNMLKKNGGDGDQGGED